MNNQEIYNKAARHLLRQKAKSQLTRTGSSYASSCAYRGINGRKCAVGALITNKEYKPDMEARSVMVIHERYPRLKMFSTQKRYISKRLDLLYCLQRVHDQFHPRDWKRQLQEVAKEFKLKSI